MVALFTACIRRMGEGNVFTGVYLFKPESTYPWSGPDRGVPTLLHTLAGTHLPPMVGILPPHKDRSAERTLAARRAAAAVCVHAGELSFFLIDFTLCTLRLVYFPLFFYTLPADVMLPPRNGNLLLVNKMAANRNYIKAGSVIYLIVTKFEVY